MPKGIFTQCVCLLTDGRVSISDIKSVLVGRGHQVVKKIAANAESLFCGPSIIVPFRPSANGYVLIDVVNKVWPDGMGEPATDPLTFGAWSMGHFGPFTYPGGLARACQHAWSVPHLKAVANRHAGYIRFRVSYVLGASEPLALLPDGYDAREELVALSQLADAVFSLADVLCYFNPNGEVLRDRTGFETLLRASAEHTQIPLPLWSNIRLFNLNERLGFMDTVGNQQLDVQDIEAVFPKSTNSPGDVDYYLRNVTQYLLDSRPDIRSGEPFDGPGEAGLSWIVEVTDRPLVIPPRPVFRLCPKSLHRDIQLAIAASLAPPTSPGKN